MKQQKSRRQKKPWPSYTRLWNPENESTYSLLGSYIHVDSMDEETVTYGTVVKDEYEAIGKVETLVIDGWEIWTEDDWALVDCKRIRRPR